MRRILIALALLAGLAGVAPAADTGVVWREAAVSAPRPEVWRYNRHSSELPFARSKRAQSVWASRACWSECQSFCTWNEAACLEVDAQGRCLKVTDRCDRACQRDCRTHGGPLLSFDMPWE